MQFLKYRKFHNVELFRFGYSPIGKPLMSVYCFLIDNVLIDTAQANCQEKVLETFRTRQIDKILLTHWHEDHSGNTASLANQHKSKVFAHEFTQQKIQEGFKILPYEKFLFGQIKPYQGKVEAFSDIIETEKHKLTPIHTPGHAIDHTVFLEKMKVGYFREICLSESKLGFFGRTNDSGSRSNLSKKYCNTILMCYFAGIIRD
ncbi:MAG: MBL fold metallo-hydrolase [Spirosomataceae bacterium]